VLAEEGLELDQTDPDPVAQPRLVEVGFDVVHAALAHTDWTGEAALVFRPPGRSGVDSCRMASGRALAQEEKRQLLLRAAVRVFAQKGFHAARVGDIAEEAGVAYGLLYHYFRSKDEVLETIFRATWTDMLATVESIAETGEPGREQLRKVTEVILRTWRRDPDLVRVLVREVTRSPQLQRQVDEIAAALRSLQAIVERGQAAGEFRDDVESRLASVVWYGALEEILTGWVLGRLPDDDDSITVAERTVVAMLTDGLAVR
jgi:TetR/AcrR family transcriptional regulator, fatty acid metabolism regulator protein